MKVILNSIGLIKAGSKFQDSDPIIPALTQSGAVFVDETLLASDLGEKVTKLFRVGDSSAAELYALASAAKSALEATPTDTVELLWSDIDRVGNNGISVAATAGNYATGSRYLLAKQLTIKGVRFYWPGGQGDRSFACNLWTSLSTGSPLATKTVVANAAGIYSVLFDTPFVMTGDYSRSSFTVSMYNSSFYNLATGVVLPSLPFVVSQGLLFQGNYYGSLGVYPVTASGSERYLVEPIL